MKKLVLVLVIFAISLTAFAQEEPVLEFNYVESGVLQDRYEDVKFKKPLKMTTKLTITVFDDNMYMVVNVDNEDKFVVGPLEIKQLTKTAYKLSGEVSGENTNPLTLVVDESKPDEAIILEGGFIYRLTWVYNEVKSKKKS